MSPDSILLLIRQKYLTADSTGQTIAKISELNNMTPAKLYSIIIPENVNSPLKSESKPVIQGTGRKTIKEISSEFGIDVDKVIEELKSHGINATPEEKLKAVAENAGLTPMEILEIIKKKS